MKLLMLGGLKLESSLLTRPKPLLLLSYLSLRGSRDRRDLAELFFRGSQDPGQGLRVTLAHLNKEASGAIRASEKRLWTELPSDVAELESALAQGEFQNAIELYKGPFLEGFDLTDLGEELEEWLYQTREHIAAKVREAKLFLAEQQASRGDFAEAAKQSEEAYLLRFAPEPEPEMLARLYTLLRAGEASVAAIESVSKEAKSYDLELALTVEEAKAKLQILAPQTFSLAPNPYVGLFAFQEKDAPFFFGREHAAKDIVQRCESSPHVVTVIGNSGAGKSSLVLAGVLPMLRKDNWLISTLRPGRQPFEALSLALTDLLETTSEREQLLESQELAKDLQEKRLELSSVVSRILAKHPQRRLLIVVDQLEELFTISQHSTIAEGEREAANFLEVLLNAVQSLQSQFSLVVTLRADFIGALLEYPPILQMLQETRYFLGPMTTDELRQAITEPARKQGVTFEAGLVQRILEDVSGQEGSLPLLEFALTQLWHKQENNTITHTSYDAIGGVEEALANHADATFNNLSEREQTLAKKVFLQLVYPGTGQEDTRRIATREELEDAWGVVQKLASYPARLLVTGYSEIGEQTAEVSHEALIRRWGMLRAWMSDYRSFRTWQERLRQDVKLWSEENRGSGETKESEENQTEVTRSEATLLRGYRLDEAVQRMNQYDDLLSSNEREFIKQSLDLRERDIIEKERQRAIQLENFQRLAAEETSRRKAEQARVRLRTNALWLLTLLGCVAVGLAVLSYNARNQAVVARNEATGLLPKLLSSVAINTKEDLPQRSLLLTLEADRIATDNNDSHAPEVQRILRQLVSETGGFTLPHSDRVTMTRFSLDGRYLGTLSEDGTVRLWARNTLSRNAALTLEVHARTFKFSPDGQWLFTINDAGLVSIWNLHTLKSEADLTLQTLGSTLKHSADGGWLVAGTSEALQIWNLRELPEPPILHTTLTLSDDTFTVFDFSVDSRYFFALSATNVVQIWETKTWTLLERWDANINLEAEPWTISSSADGQWLAAPLKTEELGQVALWDLTSGAQHILDLETPVTALNFSFDNVWLAVGGKNGQTYLWKTSELMNQGKPIVLLGHTDTVLGVAFSPDGRYLATSSKDKSIQLWLLNNGSYTHTVHLKGHESSIFALAFSPDSRWLVTGSDDHTARLWDLQTPGPDLMVLSAHGDGERRVDLSPDGSLLASGNMDGTVYLQTLADVTVSTTLGRHDSWVESVGFSPDGNLLVSASDASKGGEKVLELWNLTEQPIIATPFPLNKESKTIFDVAFSSDGNLLATAGEDKTAQLWNVNDLSKPLKIFSGHEDIVTDVALSPDGKLLATASFDTFIRIWDVKSSDKPLQILEGHQNGVRTLAFSPDGSYLATGGQDSKVKIWLTKTWQVTKTFNAGSRVWAISFSPDGNMLATANEDGSLGFWQVGTETLEHLQGHSSIAWSVTFSQDGKWLVSASEDGTVRFWPAVIEEVRQLACQKAGRNLTEAEWQDMFGTMAYQVTCPQFSQSY